MAVVAGALVALMGVTSRAGAFATPSAVVVEGLAPVEAVATRAVDAVSAVLHGLAGLWALRAQNARLRAENADLRALVLQDAQLRAENATLSALVHLSRASAAAGRPGIAATVIGRNPDSWFSALVVNKGREAGVVPGMIAVTPDGLVGRVEPGVSATVARVMLVTNPAFGVGILVARQSSRVEGTVSGRLGGQDLRATFFTATASVRPGDELLTDGLGGGVPPGIAVGTVTAVKQGDFGLVRQAVVRPAAHLQSVEDVLLLPAPTGGAAPPASTAGVGRTG